MHGSQYVYLVLYFTDGSIAEVRRLSLVETEAIKKLRESEYTEISWDEYRQHVIRELMTPVKLLALIRPVIRFTPISRKDES